MASDKEAAIAVKEHDQAFGVKKVTIFQDDGTGNLTRAKSPGFNVGGYDYVSLAQASLTDTYTFKVGGSGGTTVATITITYTDSGKGTISSVAKT